MKARLKNGMYMEPLYLSKHVIVDNPSISRTVGLKEKVRMGCRNLYKLIKISIKIVRYIKYVCVRYV